MNPIKFITNRYHAINVRLAEIPFFNSLRTELKALNRLNIYKTLRFNFAMFPFRTAIHLPVWLYGHIRIYELAGQMRFDCPIRRRLVTIGKTTDWFGAKYISTIGIHGGVYGY